MSHDAARWRAQRQSGATQHAQIYQQRLIGFDSDHWQQTLVFEKNVEQALDFVCKLLPSEWIEDYSGVVSKNRISM